MLGVSVNGMHLIKMLQMAASAYICGQLPCSQLLLHCRLTMIYDIIHYSNNTNLITYLTKQSCRVAMGIRAGNIRRDLFN